MKRRRRSIVIAEDHARGVALVRGWQAKQLLIDAGCKPLWSVSGNGWCIDLRRVSDVAAWCDYSSIRYRFEGEQ